MTRLFDLAEALRELAGDAEALRNGLRASDTARAELRDLLKREFRPNLAGAEARLRLDTVIDEIVASCAGEVDGIAFRLRDIIGDDEEERRRRSRCLDCGVDTVELDELYMLQDEVWQEANPARSGMLCIGCLEDRLGRRLEPADFTDIPMNREYGSARMRSRVLGLEKAPAA